MHLTFYRQLNICAPLWKFLIAIMRDGMGQDFQEVLKAKKFRYQPEFLLW